MGIAGSGDEVVCRGFLLLAGIPASLWMRWRVGRAAKARVGNAELPVAVDAAELELTKR